MVHRTVIFTIAQLSCTVKSR